MNGFWEKMDYYKSRGLDTHGARHAVYADEMRKVSGSDLMEKAKAAHRHRPYSAEDAYFYHDGSNYAVHPDGRVSQSSGYGSFYSTGLRVD